MSGGTVLFWRLRRNPLRRRADLFQAWLALGLFLAALAATPAAMFWAGDTAHRHYARTAQQQAAARQHTPAVLLEDARRHPEPGSAEERRTRYPTEVGFTDPGGTARTATTDVRPGCRRAARSTSGPPRRQAHRAAAGRRPGPQPGDGLGRARCPRRAGGGGGRVRRRGARPGATQPRRVGRRLDGDGAPLDDVALSGDGSPGRAEVRGRLTGPGRAVGTAHSGFRPGGCRARLTRARPSSE